MGEDSIHRTKLQAEMHIRRCIETSRSAMAISDVSRKPLLAKVMKAYAP
jgi:hypothetical protein